VKGCLNFFYFDLLFYKPNLTKPFLVDDRHFSYIAQNGGKTKKKKNTLEGKGHMSNDYGSVKSALVQAFLKGPLLLDT
jgi:hypothetical protein